MNVTNIARGAAASILFAAVSVAPAMAAQQGKQVEKLDRGVVAIDTGSGVFLSWRFLGTDDSALAFNVYRGKTKLNKTPLTTTNFLDAAGTAASSYHIRQVVKGREQAVTQAGAVWSTPYKSVPVEKPAGGTTPDGVAYTYDLNDGSAADLDGDGTYELVVKWQPTNAKDNSQSGYTGDTYLDAYKLDGTRLWRIDLGKNIRAGAHYTTFLAYDFDGDGKAEVMAKTADGTVDGAGTVIGDAAADYRNSAGYILTGPEYLTVFNGLTGAAMATTEYIPPRGTVASWGDNYGNRVDRFLGSVAYLDGSRPSAIFSRGYYTRAVIAAWDWRNGQLSSRWVFDSNVDGAAVAGQGAHSMSIADVNGDGKDDIVYGAATIGSDGKMLYSTGLCHGDALHVGKLDPNRAGLQVYMVHESPSCYGANAAELHDAATGEILWGIPASRDIGRGVCMDVDPAYLGEECWSSAGGLMNVTGVEISPTHPSSMNFASWWDGDLLREILDGTSISKWNPTTLTTEPLLTAATYGAASNNSTKATPVLSADLFGDWREEVVWRKSDNTALLVFSTTVPTTHRIPTLMHNPQYRVQVATQNTGYNQPPHPSFYLGDGMGPVVQEPIYTADCD
jgi:rhamnogalacturonan endolyase